MGKPSTLLLKYGTKVFVDWANVHGWAKSLKKEVDPEKLFSYFKAYTNVRDVRLYFGEDTHPKSSAFLQSVRDIGYSVESKPVKYIFVTEIEERKIYRRKCDFDMEMCIDVHRALNDGYGSFIFFTGDGDFEPLYTMLVGLRKQVIVVFAEGHLGKEIHQMERGIYKRTIHTLGDVFT